MDVKLYSSPTWGYCHQARQFLGERGVKFREYDVSVDRAAGQEVIRLTGQMGVPVIVVDSEVVIGFDRSRIDHLLSSQRTVQRPRLGLKVTDASRAIARRDALASGALVVGVAAASLGEKAGIIKGDIIVEIDRKPIRNSHDLEQALFALKPGQRIAIVFLRGARTLRADINIP